MSNPQSFLNSIKSHAINASKNSGMLASVLAAQACLETGYGTSDLARLANNLFGVKGSYNGQSYTVRTAEHKPNGQAYYVNAAFRKYPSYTESFKDRIAFFTSTPWRTKTYKPVTDAKSKGYKAQVKALHESPYATDVLYDKKLLNIIETYRLYEWDKNTGGNSVGYTIVNMFKPSMYHINAPYAMTPKYITIHNTGNTASARNEAAYMNSNSNYTSYHVAIDDKEAVQVVPFNRNAWHAGDGQGNGNRKSIGIEICYSMDNGYSGSKSARYKQAEENAALYIAHVLHQYGWGMDRLKRHYDWSGKDCPHKMHATGTYQAFRNRVQAHLNALKKGSTASKPSPSKPKPKPSKKPSASKPKTPRTIGSWQTNKINGAQYIRAEGTFTVTVNDGIISRFHNPSTNAKHGGLAKKGWSTKYDYLVRANGYVWIQYKVNGKGPWKFIPYNSWNSRTGAVGKKPYGVFS